MTQEEHFARWLQLPNLTTDERQALYSLSDDREAFARAFSEPLHFGTAGLRGSMGMGPAQMNDITVAWASSGVAHWLEKKGCGSARVLICGDSRQNSRHFVQVAARTLVAYGHQVTIWLEPTPVPVLSWAIRDRGADCGIAITASHNPKNDNGFKVYGSKGGQLLAEDTAIITEQFDSFLAGADLPPLPSLHEAYESGSLQVMTKEDDERFIASLITEKGIFAPFTHLHSETMPSILYTPLHGSGGAFVPKALRAAGFTKTHTVDSQIQPDGAFPTLMRPNPEDPAAFEEALHIASVTRPDLIIATDPDCDRMGCAVYHDGDYVRLTGNQLAALMIDHLSRHLPQNKEDTVITSVVSSPFGKQVALARGLRLRETLTGFKYIADLAEQMAKEGDGRFFFGYEESYGYLAGDHARDKDGVLASLLIASCAQTAISKGQTLIDRLNELYEEVGTWYDHNGDITLPLNSRTDSALAIMERLRTMRPDEVCGRPVRMRLDYKHGTFTLPPENMLQYTLPEGSVVSIRPSGTEPKIKCYVSACDNSREKAQMIAETLAHNLRLAVQEAKERGDNDIL